MDLFHTENQPSSHPDHSYHFFGDGIMDEMEYMDNTSVDIVVESTLGNMSIDNSGETDHVSKTYNTDLNKSHDV